MIRAIIFDCFGVLVGKGFEHTYRLGGGDPVADREFINDMLGQANLGMITNADFRAAMADRLGLTVEQWRDVEHQGEQPDAELLDYIQALRPRYKVAVLSNANTGIVARKIGRERLEACFDEIIVSADEGLVKPDPRIYERAAKRLGVQPDECIFIDDHEGYLKAAEQLGMRVVHYRDFSQATAAIEALLTDAKN